MSINLKKIKPEYNGYIQNSGNAMTHSVYSYLNRYPEQISAVKTIMQNSNKKTNMLIIGIAQGQEPLTHIQSAFDISKEKNKTISDVVDLTLVEAAEKMPLWDKAGDFIDKEAIDFFNNTCDDKTKAYFATPFENLVSEMKKQNKKQDVVLFNNVIQHINYGKNGEKANSILNSINDLIDLVDKDGIFCFTCEPMVLSRNPSIDRYYKQVLNNLQNKGFVNIADGVYKKTAKIAPESQKTQALYKSTLLNS